MVSLEEEICKALLSPNFWLTTAERQQVARLAAAIAERRWAEQLQPLREAVETYRSTCELLSAADTQNALKIARMSSRAAAGEVVRAADALASLPSPEKTT